MPRYDDDDDDDYPRRSAGKKKSKKRKQGANVPLLVGGGVGLLVLVVGLFFAFRWAVADRPKPGSPAAANAGGGAAPKAGGVKYVPGESEKKFEEYRKANPDKHLTDVEVFAIMGEPTRTDPPVTVRRNGMTITVYEVYWDVPGSGISSQMGFANGLEAGCVIGLRVTPRQ